MKNWIVKKIYRGQDVIYIILAKIGILKTVTIKSRGPGFFADLFLTLNGLRFAEKNNLKCHVYWGPKSLYYDPENKIENVWLYYFKDAEINFSSKNHLGLKLTYRPTTTHYFKTYKGLNTRKSVNRMLSKSCVLKDSISHSLENFWIEKTGNKRTLGLHIRGTDVVKGFRNRFHVHAEDFIEEAQKHIKEDPKIKIFLATDSKEVLNYCISKLGDRLFYNDCLRSEDNTSVHGDLDAGIEGSNYKKGLDVVLDATMLAKCYHIIKTFSRVSSYTLCVNPNLEFTDLEYKKTNFKEWEWVFD